MSHEATTQHTTSKRTMPTRLPRQYPRLDYDTVARSLPKPELVTEVEGQMKVGRLRQHTLVVLDDDPTGTQTVHNVTVLTTFEKSILREQLRKREPGFFILTNSRAYAHDAASSLLQKLMKDLHEVSLEEGVSLEIVLRSDSCLRGHFPLETQLAEECFGPTAAWVLAPAFLEGGRVTVDDVHYVRDGNDLIPVSDTPFAADSAFGYQSSNLCDWVLEKFQGSEAPSCKTVSISELRQDGAREKVALKLQDVAGRRGSKPVVLVLNAFSSGDMETFVAARALAPEVKLLYRTGASFVSAYLGISPIAPLSPAVLFSGYDAANPVGGLVIIGSYVPKTTAQRAYLLEHCKDHISHFELDVMELLSSEDQNRAMIRRHVGAVEEALRSGKDVVLSTSRELITSKDQKESLGMGKIVSGVLNSITREVSIKPKYLIAKGGITSSDIATVGLGMKRARVVGQAATGVPLWESDPAGTEKWADVPYIVFPGNVGSPETLGDLVASYRYGS